MRKHYDIRVRGRVQGVFFRAETQTQAKTLQLTGFVQNETDGSVYIETEGAPESLEKFVEWCQHGPQSAQVKSCEVTESSLKNFPDFEVRVN